MVNSENLHRYSLKERHVDWLITSLVIKKDKNFQFQVV